MEGLKGRKSIVTGGAAGIGKAIATYLARAGADVAVCDVNLEGATATATELAASGVKSLAYKFDVGSFAETQDAVNRIIADLGTVHVLVNNAGITKDTMLLRMTEQDFDRVLTVNLKGAFNMTKGVLRTLIKERWGRIINIASVIGQMGNAGQANYAASKAGLIGFTKSVALEVASRGITANVVAPGLIDTDMTRAMTGSAREEWAAKIPLRRLGTSDDIAAAVCFLASDEASYITGQVLAVNGGMYM